MKIERILNYFERASRTSKFYRDILKKIDEMNEIERKEFFDKLEKRNFKSEVEISLFLED